MSWLGEQFASITEKITDFTKEVLTENKDGLSIEGNSPSASSSLSDTPESFSQLLEKKDFTINRILKEKESLEKSIEELDQQHEEAINEILSLKQNLLKENQQLKKKLKQVEDLNQQQNLQDNICHVFNYLRSIDFHSSFSFSEGNATELCSLNNNIDSTELIPFDNFHILNVLFSLKNCSGKEQIQDLIKSLEIFRLHLDSLICKNRNISTFPKVHDTMKRINDCAHYLKSLCNHDESDFPFIRELFSFLEFLFLTYIHLKTNKNDISLSTKNIREDNISNKHSALTEPFAPNVASDKCDDIETGSNFGNYLSIGQISVSTQTSNLDHKDICHCENADFDIELVTKLSPELNHCKQKIQDFEPKASDFESQSERNETAFYSKSVQTEQQFVCSCDTLHSEILSQKLKIEELQSYVKEQEKEFSIKLENETCRLKEVMDELKLKSNLIEDKEKYICDKSNEILSLESEILKLKDKLEEFKDNQCNKFSSDNNIQCDNSKNYSQNVSFEISNNADNNGAPPLFNSLNIKPFSCLESEVLKLKDKLKEVELEKGRVMCVLNEKSQECSNLKADVHRLTAIVSSEKQALLKLQQDNCGLKKAQQDSLDPELTKEALQNLSRIIRDKDFEVEALKQRNNSLSSLVQQSCSSAEHLQSLMEERDNLTKQLNLYKSECEKITNNYNFKVHECQQYFNEIQRLNSLLSCQSEKLDVLQQQHHSVAQQYEEKQKSLINTQNEMIALKQRVTDLEQQQNDIREKYAQLLAKMNSDAMIQITKDELNCKLSEIDNLKVSLKDQENLILEKDCLIHEFSQERKKQKMMMELQETVVANLENENGILLDKIKECEDCQQKLQDVKDSINQRLNDKQCELMLQKEMNERLSMTLKEKEFSIQSMGKKICSLSHIAQGNAVSTEPSETSDIDQILAESELMFNKAELFQRERDESLLSLSQCQQENQELKNEVQTLKNKEDHLRKELDRLRQHLLQIEENYTNEALKAEEREKDLRTKLSELENSTRLSNSAVIDVSYQANVQVASLQEQVSLLANQRDKALAQVSILDDKVQQYATSLNNLQLVLEQMQKGNAQKMIDMDKKFQTQLSKEKEKGKNLEMQLKIKQIQFEESSQALEAASRLSEQLDSKEELITLLKCELSKTENIVKMTAAEVETVRSTSEGKVDRLVIKSLVLGYFSTPPGQKSEVVRLLARVLDFSQEEMQKAGIVVTRNSRPIAQRGLLSSWFGKLPSLTSSNVQAKDKNHPSEKSLASLFVQFLESESQPLKPLPLPAEKMAQELTSKSAHSQKRQKSTANPLLLDINTTFPTFCPIPISDYCSPEPSILQEVLK